MALAEKLRHPTVVQRLDRLEQRADGHDAMVKQVAEMFAVFDLTRKIFHTLNRASVKIGAACIGLLGAAAALLTIIEKVRQLTGH